jgi:hypothetical protein
MNKYISRGTHHIPIALMLCAMVFVYWRHWLKSAKAHNRPLQQVICMALNVRS